jgi:hypothetical protein
MRESKVVNSMNWKNVLKYSIFILVISFNMLLIVRDKVLFTGDMGVIGLITYDMQHGDFYSWYFYGTNYFGNLQPFILSFLTRFTGISRWSLMFWENTAMIASVVILLERLKIKNWLFYSVAGLILLVPSRLYNFTFVPMGFAWVLLVCVSLFALFDWVYQEQRLISPLAHASIISVFAISIWYNPLIITCLPAYIILLALQYRHIWSYKFTYLLYSVTGFLFGIIPFVCATIQTNYINLQYFNNSPENRLWSLVYVIRDLMLYWIDKSFVDSLRFNILNFFGSSVRPWFILLFVLSLLSCLYITVKHAKFNLILIVVLLTNFFVLATRNYPVGVVTFYFIRYGLFFYTLITFLVIRANIIQLVSSKKIILNSLSFVSIVVLAAFSIQTLIQKKINTFTTLHSQEVIYDDLKNQYSAKNVLCFNYWALCGYLAFQALDTDMNVEITDPDSFKVNVSQNPKAIKKLNSKSKNSEAIYSVIPKINLNQNQEDNILKTYLVQGEYVLIRGDYRII